MCGRPHLKKPSLIVRKISALDKPPLPPKCGRPLWMAPNQKFWG